MPVRSRRSLACLAALLAGLPGCERRPAAATGIRQPPPLSATAAQEPISPLPLTPPANLDPGKIALGKKLFHDPRLSADDSLSCASCHPLDRGGMDRLPRAKGLHGVEGPINTPTVFNSSLNFVQFWDGRAETLEDQVDSPLQSPTEMGAAWDDILRKLGQDPAYTAAFAKIYPDGLRRANVKNAIAEFEHTLLTPNSRFDRFLRGDASALTPREKTGYLKFKSYGCVSCHQGVNIGANLFQRMGVIGDYFADRGDITPADLGRFNVTGQESDRHVFKVPSLRNVAVTAPYFHDSSARTLEEAVAVMAKYQLGRPLPPEDLSDIVQFLGTLTGEFEGKAL